MLLEDSRMRLCRNWIILKVIPNRYQDIKNVLVLCRRISMLGNFNFRYMITIRYKIYLYMTDESNFRYQFHQLFVPKRTLYLFLAICF